jgi:hypothetical protein
MRSASSSGEGGGLEVEVALVVSVEAVAAEEAA